LPRTMLTTHLCSTEYRARKPRARTRGSLAPPFAIAPAAWRYSLRSAAPVDYRWIVGRDTDRPAGSVIVSSAAPFREMGSANFAVSFYTGWPHSLDSEAPQLGDIRRDPPRFVARLIVRCGAGVRVPRRSKILAGTMFPINCSLIHAVPGDNVCRRAS